MRTTPRICARKKRFADEAAAMAVAGRADVTLRVYRCALCRDYHLTSRTRGIRVPRPQAAGR